MPFNPIVRVRDQVDIDALTASYQSEGEAFVDAVLKHVTDIVQTLRTESLAEFDANGGRLPIVKSATFTLMTTATTPTMFMVLFELATAPQ